MKRPVLLFCLACTLQTLLSQDAKHTVKLNLLSPLLKTLSAQYEYSLSSKKSLLLQAGYKSPSNLLERYYGRYKSFDTRKLIFKDLRFNGGFQITPEFRYYFKDKQNSGFFVGAYLRYARYSIQSHVNYTGDNFNVTFTFRGTYTTSNIGVISGYKWLMGKHFVLESWLLCIHAGANKFRLSAKDEFDYIDKPVFLQDLQNSLDNFPFVRNWASNITDRNVHVGFGYPFVGTRLGLCLGYRF